MVCGTVYQNQITNRYNNGNMISVSISLNINRKTNIQLLFYQLSRCIRNLTVTMIPSPKVLKDYNDNFICIGKLTKRKIAAKFNAKDKQWYHCMFVRFIYMTVLKLNLK